VGTVGVVLAIGSLGACGGAVADVAIADAAANDSSSVADATADVTVEDDADAGANGDAAADVGTADGTPVPTTITFVSGSDWPWFAGDLGGVDGGSLGMAAVVCVTPTTPPNCPAGAVCYQSGAGVGWTADTSAFPTAYWIWRGDVSPNAVGDLQFAVFQKQFVLGANPRGAIHIAADDFAEVQVNGSFAGSTGSVTDTTLSGPSQSVLSTIDLDPYLVEGDNTITIIGQNGPASFGGCLVACTYAQNPAGVVFGGTLTSY
jgi:hypothetical protein